MNIKNLILISFTAVVMSACNSNNAPGNSNDATVAMTMSEDAMQKGHVESSASSEKSVEKSISSENIANSHSLIETKKKIIKDGAISVKSRNLALSKKNTDETIKKLGAYYESEDLQNNDQATSYNLIIRIPSDNFEKLITALEAGTDEIISKHIQARDVTEEYVDIETRLINKRAYLKRYQELLSKARNVTEILEIESNIRIIEEEIESREGRLKYLTDQISFSTLTINLYQEKEYVYKPIQEDKFTERVKKALSNGWSSAVDFILWIINNWAVIMIASIVIYLIRKFIQKRRSGNN